MWFDKPVPATWGASKAEWRWYCERTKGLGPMDADAIEGHRIWALVQQGVPPLARERPPLASKPRGAVPVGPSAWKRKPPRAKPVSKDERRRLVDEFVARRKGV